MPDLSSIQQLRDKARNDLLPRLSLTEKVRLLSGGSMWTLKEVPSLKELEDTTVWLSDGPHGVRKQHDEWVTDLLNGRVAATCFPTASCLACSWDAPLLTRMGKALNAECHMHGVSVLLGPGINIMRHARGGRNFEYYSEDPYLTGVMAGALVHGVQSSDNPVGVSLKHFQCNNQETWRFVLDVIVDERTQREIYEAAFEHVIRTEQPWTVMCAYNQVNGSFNSENSLFNDRLRKEWNFEGLVMTDWGATNNRVEGIRAGVDLEMPGSVGACDDQVLEAVKNGELSEKDVDDCVVRVLALMLRSKEQLDRVAANNQNSDDSGEHGNISNIDSHHELAKEVALKSIVLLKNENNILPIKQDIRVAVIGAFAKKPRFQGMGSSEVNASKVNCAWDRIQEYTKQATYAPGYDRHKSSSSEGNATLIKEAVEVAKQADVVLIFAGLLEISESEAFDRKDLELSPGHNTLIEAVAAVNPGKIVVILSNGSSITMPWAHNVSGILESWLCGQAGASAAVDLLFGKASPCGKLAQTFPAGSLENKDGGEEPGWPNKWFPGVDRQVQYREGLNVGYRYYNSADKDVLFPFGHGLSYSKFQYTNLQVQQKVLSTTTSIDDDAVEVLVSVDVENVGSVEAGEVVQCYVHDIESQVYRPHHELKGFDKVYLKPQEKVTVSLTLNRRAFAFWDVGAQRWGVEAGDFEVQVGSSSRDIRVTQILTLASADVTSQEAKLSHPPVLLNTNDGSIDDSDAAFKAMLGHDIPVASLPSKLQYNSLLGDTQHTVIGKLIKSTAVSMMLAHMEVPSEEEVKFSNELLDNSPMRSLVLFSRGDMHFALLDSILHMMNGEYGLWLWKFPWTIGIVLYNRCFLRKKRM